MRVTMLSPIIKLVYYKEGDDGKDTVFKEELANGFIPMENQTLIEFPINLAGYPQNIVYDMVEDCIIEPNETSYQMFHFQLLKMDDLDLGIFTGTLVKINTDESITTIRLIGRMVGPHLPIGVSFKVVPEPTK